MERPQWRAKSSALGTSFTVEGELITATQPQRQTKLLVDGNCDELFPQLAGIPGAWVLSCQAQILQPFPGAGQQVVPLVCTIDFGSGGASQRAQVDVFPGFTLQLPSTTIKASIDWEDLPPAAVPGVDLFRLPLETRVTASVHRGTCLTGARRSFLLERDSANPTHTYGVVPPFAKSVGLYGPAAFNGYLVGSYVRIRTGVVGALGGTTLDVDGLNLLANMQGGTEAVVAGHSTVWDCYVSAGDANIARVDYLVRL